MAWYRTGRASSVAGSNIITGTGTLWASNVFGIAPGQILAVPGGGSILQYEILAVDSDTKIRIATNATTTVNNSEYAIVTTVANSYSALARETSAQLALYQKLLEDWQNITTGTGDVTIIAPDGTKVVIPALGEGSLVPIGVPLPYPLATPPAGFLKCNGSSFSTAKYPKLALAYPSGVLPDLRGEFIRGWDDGRRVDSGRAILSSQSHAMQRMTGSVNAVHAQTVGAAFSSSGVLGMSRVDSTIPPPGGGASYGGFSVSFDNNVSGINTATENRPRNIAFNYIVRAA